MLRIGGAGHAPGARTNGHAEGGLFMREQRHTEFGAHREPRVCEDRHCHQQRQQVSVTYRTVRRQPVTSFHLFFVFPIVLITTNCSRYRVRWCLLIVWVPNLVAHMEGVIQAECVAEQGPLGTETTAT
jgi:hypothetical protein